MDKLPGDLKGKELINQIIRVNHSGEYAAKCIYKGQMIVLKNPEDQKLLQTMADQEDAHLNYFSDEIINRKVRPSVFLPLWHVLGYGLGIGSALLGKNAAMVCTDAVEEVIDKHYQSQLEQLGSKSEEALASNIEKFRQEEIEHQHIAQTNMKNLNLGHKLLYNVIKLGCKLSINIAKKF